MILAVIPGRAERELRGAIAPRGIHTSGRGYGFRARGFASPRN